MTLLVMYGSGLKATLPLSMASSPTLYAKTSQLHVSMGKIANSSEGLLSAQGLRQACLQDFTSDRISFSMLVSE